MAIYTKQGDQGKTSLYLGDEKVSKDDLRVWAVGGIDELNSHIGFALALITDEEVEIASELRRVQTDLFEIAAELGTFPGKDTPFSLPLARIKALEKVIDKLEGSLPVLTNFIFPGGSSSSAAIHVARSVCRRAERMAVRLSQSYEVNPSVLQYLNRLSDFLFMVARGINKIEGKTEDRWKGKG